MQHNPVGWFEIYVQDMDRATAFYNTVLGHPLEKLEAPEGEADMRAFPMSEEGQGASGALVKMADVPSTPGGTLVYFSCEDCGVEASRIEAAGGQLKQPKMAIGEYGFIALAIDTEGNMFGLHSRT